MDKLLQLENDSKRKHIFLDTIFFLTLSYLIFFHNIGSHLILMFQLDFLIVIPFTLKYYRKYSSYYFNNQFIKSVFTIFIAMALWNLVSVIAGKYFTNYPTTLKGLSLSVIYITMLMYFVFGAILSIKSRYFNLQVVIRVVSILLIAIVLIEYFDQGFANFLKYYYDVFDDMIRSNDPNKFRLIGTLKNSNNLGLMSVTLLYLTLFNKGNWILKAIVAVGFVIVIFLTGSRTAFVLLLFVSFFYLANIWSLRNVVVLVLIVAVMGIAMTSFFDIYSTVLFRRIENTELKHMFYTRQTFYWESAMTIIFDVPITGIGRLGNEKFTVDNFYLNLTRTNGIVGLLLWFTFLFQTISLSVRSYFNSTNAKILLGIAIIVLSSSITADFYYSRFFYPLFMIIFGYYTYELLKEKNYFNKSKYKIPNKI